MGGVMEVTGATAVRWQFDEGCSGTTTLVRVMKLSHKPNPMKMETVLVSIIGPADH